MTSEDVIESARKYGLDMRGWSEERVQQIVEIVNMPLDFRFKAYQSGLFDGSLTYNQCRGLEGLQPVSGCDSYFRPLRRA